MRGIAFSQRTFSQQRVRLLAVSVPLVRSQRARDASDIVHVHVLSTYSHRVDENVAKGACQLDGCSDDG